MPVSELRLGDVVRQHRRLAGLSQLALAKLASVGKTVVFDIEHDKESVQLDTLGKVLAVLNLHLELRSPVLDRLAITEAKAAAKEP